MPYKIKKYGKNKAKVCKPTGKCFSKRPMPLSRAKRQLSALHMNTNEHICFNHIVNELIKESLLFNGASKR